MSTALADPLRGVGKPSRYKPTEKDYEILAAWLDLRRLRRFTWEALAARVGMTQQGVYQRVHRECRKSWWDAEVKSRIAPKFDEATLAWVSRAADDFDVYLKLVPIVNPPAAQQSQGQTQAQAQQSNNAFVVHVHK